ncbi:MAG: TIGR00269 family protein, partial [Thermoplasmata archaeon]
GKDSSATAVLLSDFLGNRRYIKLVGITIDEGIASYRPAGVESAKRLCGRLGIEHCVLSYEESAGHTMDEVVTLDSGAIPCSYCGPFRRQALNRAAREIDADFVATGLNLDDTAQSILMNVARGDIEKLARFGPHESRQPGLVPRIQPLRMIPEKEVYLYALLRGIEFHDATCPYAERAQRGRFREILHRLEEDSPGTRHAIVSGYDQMRPLLQSKYPAASLNACARCGEPTVNAICKACELRERIARIAADALTEPVP